MREVATTSDAYSERSFLILFSSLYLLVNKNLTKNTTIINDLELEFYAYGINKPRDYCTNY